MRVVASSKAAGVRLLALALGIVLTLGSSLSRPSQSTTAALSITAPFEVMAGTSATIDLDGVAAGQPTVLLVISSIGSTQIVVPAAAGQRRRVAVPTSITDVAGLVTFVAQAGETIETFDMVVRPGPVVGPIVSIVGARSIVADGSDVAMVVSIPTDRLNNAVAARTPFTFVRRNPDGSSTATVTETTNLLAWAELGSGTVAGNGEVWILSEPTSSGERLSGPRARLDEVAGVPRNFAIDVADSAMGQGLVADGRSLLSINTDVLVDAFGNVQPDGTQVVFEWVSELGASQAYSETIAGVATIRVQAPSSPGVIYVQARARGVLSTPIEVTYSSAVTSFDIRTTRVGARTQIVIGPIVTAQGSLVADGTEATVRIMQTGHSVEYRGWTVDGLATVTIPVNNPGSSFSAEVLGLVVEGAIR